jgi:hypothetical protein
MRSRLITRFVEKLVAEVASGRVDQALLLTNNYTDTRWFHTAARVARALCFTRGRIKFINPQGAPYPAPIQGQVIFYMGPGSGDVSQCLRGVWPRCARGMARR